MNDGFWLAMLVCIIIPTILGVIVANILVHYHKKKWK